MGLDEKAPVARFKEDVVKLSSEAIEMWKCCFRSCLLRLLSVAVKRTDFHREDTEACRELSTAA